MPRSARLRLEYKSAAFTPNFPAYPSGHSTFGSAAFNVLIKARREREETSRAPDLIRNAGEFVSEELNGVSIDNFRNEPRPYLPIRYASIRQMIEDNNRSRVLLGIHWNFDAESGRGSGAEVADRVYALAYRRRL